MVQYNSTDKILLRFSFSPMREGVKEFNICSFQNQVMHYMEMVIVCWTVMQITSLMPSQAFG